MWIMTNTGFLSAVQHDKYENVMVVRARNKEVLDDFNEEIVESRDSDYRFRVFVTRGQFYRFLERAVKDIDYTNFKNSIKDKRLSGFAMNIWSAGMNFQDKYYGRQHQSTFIPNSYYEDNTAFTNHNYSSGYLRDDEYPDDEDVIVDEKEILEFYQIKENGETY